MGTAAAAGAAAATGRRRARGVRGVRRREHAHRLVHEATLAVEDVSVGFVVL